MSVATIIPAEEGALFSWPTLSSLKSSQWQKVAAVALAVFALFTFQLSYSFIFAAKVAALCASLTLISELFLRQGAERGNEWFSVEQVSQKNLLEIATCFLISRPIILHIATRCFDFELPQMVAQLILTCDPEILLLVNVIGPIVEEIVFRGFIQERLEDIASLASRYIIPITKNTQETLATIFQASIFGFCHITGDQVATLAGKIYIFLATTCVGFWMSSWVTRENSLISAIGLHMAQNTSMSVAILSLPTPKA